MISQILVNFIAALVDQYYFVHLNVQLYNFKKMKLSKNPYKEFQIYILEAHLHSIYLQIGVD